MDILIAEDSNVSRNLLKGILTRMSFNVIESVDGLDAWNKLNVPNPPRIALIDWIMPNLSGIELVRKIRDAEEISKQYTYIIMITSNSDEKDSNLGFASGVDNFLTKPVDPHLLSITLKVAKRIIQQQEYLQKIQEKLAEQLYLQKEEIKRAQEIQQILNTHEIPLMENINLQAVYCPSQEMGGDFFNILRTVRGNLAVILVDCTGHGLEASMYATLLKSVCDRHIYLLDNPKFLANFVQMVNIDIAGYITTDQFPVMFASVFDPESMKFYYSSANGEHPYLIRDNEVYPLARVQGMHLGYNTESQYLIKSFKVNYDDIIFYYSDAIIEIKNAPWNRENDDVLKKELSKTGTNLITYNNNIIDLVTKSSGSNYLNDDLSLIYLQIKKPLSHLSTISSVNEIEENILWFEDTLYNYNYPKDEIERTSIAFRELLLNAIVHGNNSDNSKKVKIEIHINCKYIEIIIEDQGEGFDEKDIPDPTNLERLEHLINIDDVISYTHGRGIWLVRKLIDKLIYSEGGTKVTAIKHKDKVYTYNNYKTPIENK